MPLKTHVAAPGSTNSEGLTTTSARQGLVSMCACTKPDGTGKGGAHVGRDGLTWPKQAAESYKHTHLGPFLTNQKKTRFVTFFYRES